MAVTIAMVLALVLLFVRYLHPSLNSAARWIFVLAIVVSGVPILLRLRDGGISRQGWGLLLIAELLTALAGALYGKFPAGTNPFAPPTMNLVLAVLISVSATTGVTMLILQSARVLDRVLVIDAAASGLAVASVVGWLYLHRIFRVNFRDYLSPGHPENLVVGLLLFWMIILISAALSLVDITGDRSRPFLAGAVLVIGVGEVLAIHAGHHELTNWGALLDTCWITGYGLVGVAVSNDRGAALGLNSIGAHAVLERQSRKLAVFGTLAIAVIVLSAVFEDPPIVGGLALASLAILIVRLLVSLRLERANANLFETLANTDPLTGLANRRTITEQITTDSSTLFTPQGGVLLIDLDNFKEVNDALGHRAGDLLLVSLASRLQSFLGERHLARIGGDEFVVECGNGTRQELIELADQLNGLIREPIMVDGLALSVSASIGVASRTGDEDSSDNLIRRADVAMYRAKELKSGFQHYEFEHDRNDPSRLVMYGELSASVKDKSIDVHFQPFLNIADGRIRGCEALARWTSPSTGPVPPDRFIPMVELQGLVVPFTAHVLNEAIRHTRSLDVIGNELGVSVNVSERDFINSNFPNIVSEVLCVHNFRPDRLTIEITENVIANDDATIIYDLHRLRELGVRVSIDDFGTGYSSLSKLMNYPVDELKIDQVFVSNILNDYRATAIVRASVELARSMDLTLVAEGIEDEATLQFLEVLGVGVAQGYHIARPMPTAECDRFLRETHVRGGRDD